MAIVTGDYLSALRTQYRALFQREFKAAMGLQGWRELAIHINTNAETVSYNWFDTVPQMQDVTTGSLTLQGLRYDNFQITNKEYQAGIEVERAAMERDQLSLIQPRISQLGMEAARHPGELLFNLVKDNKNAFDGSAFFGDTRTIGDSANIDNNLAGTAGSDAYTIAEFQADLATAVGTMRLFQDDQGRPMNLRGNVIMVPTMMEQVVWQALNRGAMNDGVVSPVIPMQADGTFMASNYKVCLNPYLTDTNDWYLFHVGGAAYRPFIWQEEVMPRLESDTDPNSRETILSRKFVYSVYARYAVGMTDPRFGIKVANS